MREMNYPSVTTVLLTASLVSGCSGGDDEITGAFCGGVHPVEDDFDASLVAGNIAGAIEDAISSVTDGTATDLVLNGDEGTITLNGTIDRFSNESCGTDCITSGNNTSVSAAMSSYVPPGGIVTLSGTIEYTDTTRSTQNGLSFSTSGNISISHNTSINYDATDFDENCNPRVNGTQDTITAISASGDSSSSSSLSGTLTGSGGTFSF